MAQLMSVWTDRHTAAAAALGAVGCGGAVAVGQALPGAVTDVPSAAAAAAGAVLATALLALLLDAFGGLVAGLAAAAVVIALQRLTGTWTAERFPQALALVVALMLIGWLSGRLASRLRAKPGEAGEHGVVRPAFGSLGLLPEEAAVVRLEEELLRSRRHRRPLSVLVLRTTVEPAASAEVRDGSLRAVARVLETLLRDTDVPFALAADELGAVLPETGQTAAWDLLGPVLEAAGSASFAVREDGERRSVADTAELHAGLVAVSGDETSARALLEQARALALADQRSSAVDVGSTVRRPA